MIGAIDSKIQEALLEAIPIEFSIIDADDQVLAWNKHKTRIFKRPEAVLGLNVRHCHPEKSLAQVLRIIEEMKAGKREKASFWIDISGEAGKAAKKVLIEYYALRAKNGKYMGCLEASQDITQIQKLQGEKRLLD
ncbi:MAG: PAS domain-containing protein [Candidatus Omnitrophota bacterium]